MHIEDDQLDVSLKFLGMAGRKLWASEPVVTGTGASQVRPPSGVRHSSTSFHKPIVRLSTTHEGRAWWNVMPPLLNVSAPRPALTIGCELQRAPSQRA